MTPDEIRAAALRKIRRLQDSPINPSRVLRDVEGHPMMRQILENLGFSDLSEWSAYWSAENRRLGKITLEEERAREAYIRSAMSGSKCDLRKERAE